MDKIRLDFFDILGYLIPGTAMLLSLWITADASVHALADLYGFISKIDTKTLLSGVVVAYIFGFTLHFFGSWMFRQSQKFPFKPLPPQKIKTADMPREWAILRQHAEKHLPILDRWQALKALASNLGAYSFLAIFLCILKWQLTGHWEWVALSPLFLGLMVLYLQQARVFHTYLDDDSSAVLDILPNRSIT